MWVADVNGDLSGAPANVWWLLGIFVTTGAGLLTTYILSRRPSRTAISAAEPVAAQTSRDAVSEYRLLFMVPMQEENSQLRERIDEQQDRIAELEREVTLAERAQASAERDNAAAQAELSALRPQFQKALRDLAEERRPKP